MTKYASFHFKEFSVSQEKCAMKIGTDAILLGAWAQAEIEPVHILDVGCGSGLISLMMAQRYLSSTVTAIDIDAGAYHQSLENFENSPWNNRLKVFQCDVLTYQFSTTFDLIVSNPPYFDDALKADTKERNLARHTDSLKLHQLMRKVSELLSIDGTFCLIYPIDALENILQLAKENQLYIKDIRAVQHNENKEAKRVLIRFQQSIVTTPYSIIPFYIREKESNNYSNEYISLTKNFHPFL